MISQTTIAAISTPPGTGAIAVVRLSGHKAFAIARQIFSAASTDLGGRRDKQQKVSLVSHRAQHGYIIDPESHTLIDEVILIPYQSPKSYTGEDLVEINCHGGALLSREILSLCLRMGAHLAEAGEFTKRAYLSGRLDLTQAEAVLDLIQSRTARQGQMSLSALAGELGERISQIRADLSELTCRITAGIDFPEEIGELPLDDIEAVVERSRAALSELSATSRSGRFLRQGLRLAIVGRPNAGKSSLLNQLLKFDRAIVTEIPGTTRDSLEELLDLNGIPVILVDTAGVRQTEDVVEKIGIQRTARAVETADLTLMLIDLTAGWHDPEEEIAAIVASRAFMLIGNKVDLKPDGALEVPAGIRAAADGLFNLSARTGEGIDELKAAIEKWVFAGQAESISLNARQGDLCLRAIEALDLVCSTLAGGMPQDCLATDLKAALNALSEICGEQVGEEVIAQVFANFCIGK